MQSELYVSVHAHACAQAPIRARGKAVCVAWEYEEAQAGSDAVRSVTVSFAVTEQDASSSVRKCCYYLGLLRRHSVVYTPGNF